MTEIKRVLITNHTHHDIGFNDFQAVSFRQHGEFVKGALDLIEATADRPYESQYRWTCEVTGPLVKWLKGAGASEVERMRHWQAQGAIDICAMQYNTTPMLTPEQMRRSLEPVRILRDEYGLQVDTAMQDDVNGASWLFTDYLLDSGIDFFTMAINQHRGRAPRPFPGGFWWEAPSGRKLLVWNGFHYLFGRSQAKFGDWERVENAFGYYLETLQNAEWFPYDTLYCESTHPMRVDNGPSDQRMADFVNRWNEEGRGPVLEFAHPKVWRDELRSRYADSLPTVTGDWTDWWADGVASSARETGISRSTHELIETAEMLGTWLPQAAAGVTPERLTETYETMSLYDEHTWGAFSSIDAPDALFSEAQWNYKSGLAYTAAMETHDMLTRSARDLADQLAERGPEGVFNLGDLPEAAAYPEQFGTDLLVFNPLPFERDLVVEVPQYRAGGAPGGMLESFFPRDVPWGGNPSTPVERRRVTVPAFGYAFTSPEEAIGEDGLSSSESSIENDFYRVEIDNAAGIITSIYDKELDREIAGSWEFGGPASYVYETVDVPDARNVIFQPDYSQWDFGTWNPDTPFNRRGPRSSNVTVESPDSGIVALNMEIEADGIVTGNLRVWLQSRERAVHLDWLLDKTEHIDVESVYIGFPFNLGESSYLVDLNGLPLRPGEDQIQGTAMDFHPVRRWAAVSDGEHTVTLVPQDTPLIQLGGINTAQMLDKPFERSAPILVAWGAQNHWHVNFQPQQKGRIPMRFVVTSHAGTPDVAKINMFAQEQLVSPVILRDYKATGERQGSFLDLVVPATVEVNARRIGPDGATVLTLRNIESGAVKVSVPSGARPFNVFSRQVSGEALPDALEIAGRAEISILLPTSK